MVNTVTPVLSQVVNGSEVNDLPLPTRNAASLVLLVPGTTNANSHGSEQGTTKQLPDTTSISVNGTRTDQIAFNLDGADNQDLLSNTNDPFPFPDAVQEFSVQTNDFSAQYGENAGAVVNVVSKSGTNQWHGDAFEYLRNDVFNARNSFEQKTDPLKQNQFGGTIGGPIKKNKSFIFFGYQRTTISDTLGGQSAVVPTPANLNGDFSNYLTTGPTNPLGSAVQLTDPVTGAPIPGNLLTADPNTPVNTVAVNLSKYLPVSSESPNGTVFFTPLEGQRLDEFDIRFDQTVRGQDHLTGRAYIDRFTSLPSYDGTDVLTLQNNYSGDGSTVQSQNYMISYAWAKSATFVNTTYLSYLRTASDRSEGGNVPQLGTLGANVPQLPKSEGGLRTLSVPGYFGVGLFTNGAFYRNSADIRDDANWVHGNHTITFGGDWEHDQSIVRNTNLENGSLAFDASDYTDNALANFITGNLYSYAQDSGNWSDQHQNAQGIFIQDAWHASRRLTLDGGLRWEPQVPIQEVDGRVQQFF
ncbi:MAG: carboxypeptidase regulatory-like domain-containing protein, partial [Gammaproteobacteria bacterium]